jgi:hypothetical protein
MSSILCQIYDINIFHIHFTDGQVPIHADVHVFKADRCVTIQYTSIQFHIKSH